MLMRTDQDGLLFVGELSHGNKVPKMDHLVCFLPGKKSLTFRAAALAKASVYLMEWARQGKVDRKQQHILP